MAGLKFTVTSSIYGKQSNFDQLIRRMTTFSTALIGPNVVAYTNFNTGNGALKASMTLIRKSECLPALTWATTSWTGLSENRDSRGHGFCAQPSRHYCTSPEKERGSAVVADMVRENTKDSSWHGDAAHGTPQLPPQPQCSSKVLTLPTILTIGRVAAVPLLVSTFYIDGWLGTTATTGIFIAAAITDWLDGYLARKMGLGTAFGAFLDPVADKLMVAATLLLLCSRPNEISGVGQVQWLVTIPAITIIGREITMSAIREWAASQHGKVSEAVAVNNLGKWKTATQMVALAILLAARDSSLSGWNNLFASGIVLLYISAGLTVWSLVVYMRKIWRFLLKR